MRLLATRAAVGSGTIWKNGMIMTDNNTFRKHAHASEEKTLQTLDLGAPGTRNSPPILMCDMGIWDIYSKPDQ